MSLLVPYNDSMRLGQGFNSYTHELCIDGAVEITTQDIKMTKSPVQDVSYSSRFVERLSDVMETMNISYSKAIKKSTIEIAGNTSAVDETTFNTSDLNVVVSVKVKNQTATVGSNGVFKPLDHLIPGTAEFNQVYGDCYISGFIEGGNFTGILSIKVLESNSSKKATILEDIKTALSPAEDASDATEFTPSPLDRSGQSKVARALKRTQVTISVGWTGGGQIKDETVAWDFGSIYAAAAAFPTRVASCPQRTWAILTKYKSNRSFVEYAKNFKLAQTLEYDQINSYTAELFNSFMDYKLLLSKLQDVIAHRERYKKRKNISDAIETTMPTLLSVRSAMRNEQAKIVQAIDALAKDPGILHRQGTWRVTHRASNIACIIKKALGENWSLNFKKVPNSPVLQPEATPPREETQEIYTDNKFLAADGKSNSTEKQVNSAREDAHTQAPQGGGKSSERFDFSSLVPPEIWQDLMPESIEESFQSSLSQSGLVTIDDVATTGSSSGLQMTIGFNIAAQTPSDTEAKHVQILIEKAMLEQELKKAQEAAETALKDAADARVKLQSAEETIAELKVEISSLESSFNAEKGAIAKENTNLASKLQAIEKFLENERTTTTSLTSSVIEKDGYIDSLKKSLEAEKTDKRRFMVERDQARSDKDAAIRALQALKPNIWPLEPRQDKSIWIMFVCFGNKFIRDQRVIDRCYEYAHSKATFQFTPAWFFGDDPMPGVYKTALILYKYDDKGLIRYLYGWERHDVHFDYN